MSYAWGGTDGFFLVYFIKIKKFLYIKKNYILLTSHRILAVYAVLYALVELEKNAVYSILCFKNI